MVVEVDAFRRYFQSEKTTAGLEKMVAIFFRLEPDEIGAQKAFQQSFSGGQTAEDFRRWERCVHEEANLGVGESLSEHGGQEQKVVVVDPDPVPWLPSLRQSVGKRFIDLDVLSPRMVIVFLVPRLLLHLVVKSRPENGSTEVGIVTLEFAVADKDRERSEFFLQSLCDAGAGVLLE